MLMVDSRTAALNYIRFVLKSLGETPSGLARMAGVSTTTLTRPLNDKTHKFSISNNTIDRIVRATGYEFFPFLERDMDSVARTLDTYENVSSYMLTDSLFDEMSTSGQNGTPILGDAQVGLWIEERFLHPPGAFVLIRYPNDRMQKRCVILFVRGKNINRMADDGEMLFCHLEEDTLPPPLDGELVVIERADRARRIFEISARVARVNDAGTVEFSDFSTDAKFQGTVPADGGSTEDVRIVARVLYVLRHPLPR